MWSKLFVDSSGWIAYFLKGEPKHEKIKYILQTLIRQGKPLYTSNDVIDETVTRLISQTNLYLVKSLITFINQSVNSKSLVEFWTDEETQIEGFRLVEKYFDHKLSLTDATTVILVRRFNIDAILTLDSDFAKIGQRTLP